MQAISLENKIQCSKSYIFELKVLWYINKSISSILHAFQGS